jgi:type II secretory pathway pseudopilin PulG
MSGENLGLIELILSFSLVLIFAAWQLISLRRDNKKAEEEKRAKLAGETTAASQAKAE